MPHVTGKQPPWWPDDFAWPPTDQAWSRQRARIVRKLVLFLLGFGLVMCLFGWGMSIIFRPSSWEGGPSPHLWIIAIVLVTAVVTALIKMSHFRKGLSSVVDLMEAADRVATGDYSHRVEPRGAGEIQKLAASFNSMVERLQLNDDQRRRLLADIAHEFRTPLAVIQGTIEGVIDGVYPNDAAHLEPLLSEVAVMTRLLDDLQLLAHAEAGQLVLHREPVDLAALIAEVIAAYQPQARQADVALLAKTGTLPEIELDPIRIRQVLENLLSNALRYTPAGGNVTITAHFTTHQIVTEVRDTGRGMSDDEREKMFERFVKSADSGGSGLGLAIARSLVEAHGGTIRADAAPGGGTTVRFTLPHSS
jgi:signal transduction histidine kinase